MEGTSIGRYRLIRLLGEGGMGQVYLATAGGPSGFEKQVALKVINSARDRNETHCLLREAFIGLHLDHDHVVEVLDFGEDEDRHYVVMEYVRGHSLGLLIEYVRQAGERLPPRLVTHLGRAVADALHYLHNLSGERDEPLGLFHGDVSPANILLGINGRIKLSDFGVAALTREAEGADRVAGKPAYLPPEAFAGAERKPHWDVYSLGVVLFEALSLQRPYAGGTVDELRASMIGGPRSLARLAPSVPPDLAAVVDRSVSPDPARRFESAASLRAALDASIPRQVEDAERFRAALEDYFSREGFIAEYGDVPSTNRLAPETLAPYMTSAEELTVAVRSMPALRLGLSPALGAETARAHGDRLAALLTARMGREVRTSVFGDYQNLVESLARGEVDLAWIPPIPFQQAADRGAGLVVVAQRGGRISYESALVVRADSEIEELSQLRGKTVAWVDAKSAGGHIFAAALIARKLGRLESVFSRQHFHGSHRLVCEAVLNGWSAAGATYAVRDDDGNVLTSAWMELVPEEAAQLEPIAFCGPIPADAIAHRPHLPDKLIAELRAMFTSLGRDDDSRGLLAEIFGAEGMVEADLDLYDPVRDAMSALRDG